MVSKALCLAAIFAFLHASATQGPDSVMDTFLRDGSQASIDVNLYAHIVALSTYGQVYKDIVHEGLLQRQMEREQRKSLASADLTPIRGGAETASLSIDEPMHVEIDTLSSVFPVPAEMPSTLPLSGNAEQPSVLPVPAETSPSSSTLPVPEGTFIWEPDSRKFTTFDTRMVSPGFVIKEKRFKVQIVPSNPGVGKGKSGFNRANGNFNIFLKCEDEASDIIHLDVLIERRTGFRWERMNEKSLQWDLALSLRFDLDKIELKKEENNNMDIRITINESQSA